MPTKAELQTKIDTLNKNQGKSITYESLVGLIVDNSRRDEEWKRDFKEQWAEFKEENKESHEKLRAYNAKQNGRQADMMKEIAILKKESLTRELTCGAAVKAMQEAAKERKEEVKTDRMHKLSKRQWIAVYVVSLVISSTAVGGLIISIISMN